MNIMDHVGEGGHTFQIAHRAGIKTAQARRHLIRAEKAGLVKRHERYTAVNDIYWVPGEQA